MRTVGRMAEDGGTRPTVWEQGYPGRRRPVGFSLPARSGQPSTGSRAPSPVFGKPRLRGHHGGLHPMKIRRIIGTGAAVAFLLVTAVPALAASPEVDTWSNDVDVP